MPPQSSQRSSGRPLLNEDEGAYDGVNQITTIVKSPVEKALPYLPCKVKLNLDHTRTDWSDGRSTESSICSMSISYVRRSKLLRFSEKTRRIEFCVVWTVRISTVPLRA